VMSGMVSAVVLSVLFVPIFFVVVRGWFKGSERQRKLYAHELEAAATGTPQPQPQSPAVPDAGSSPR